MKPYVVTVTLNPAIDKTIAVESLTVGGVNRVKSIRLDSGGKGINVAKVLQQFAVEVTATGFIGGAQGQLLRQYLAAEQIGVDFLEIPGETRTNLKIVDDSTSVTTEVNEAGFTVAESELERLKEKLAGLLEGVSFLVLSGSLPPCASHSIYRELIEMARSKGVKAILDADGEALQEGVKAAPFAIKPNIHELEKLLGRPLSDTAAILQAASSILAKGVSLMIVSMGAKGAVIVDQTQAFWAKTGTILPGSTVGAGDSMVAALVYAWRQRFSMAQIAQWVTAAGTVTASKAGTQVCSLAEVKAFMDQVRIEPLHRLP
ncbi:1-phosphofructokinase|uniref:Tagatose-6-phosphate kinase n=1 Tax=Dendrosporobacter quercicolus TaxID=146817 RepID=A0A1G9W5K0_9FIRM|nr:1-phosphofructokinase [Dendrosporobacter quercicolus]NSL47718.1 1-phosphofructokinase [Dendrosporobacter quercicolus DSM 1736]SDM79583.1 fructose-1-phosphate kinase [Dendrosporobacter quercicolus]